MCRVATLWRVADSRCNFSCQSHFNTSEDGPGPVWIVRFDSSYCIQIMHILIRCCFATFLVVNSFLAAMLFYPGLIHVSHLKLIEHDEEWWSYIKAEKWSDCCWPTALMSIGQALKYGSKVCCLRWGKMTLEEWLEGSSFCVDCRKDQGSSLPDPHEIPRIA